ncbi:MAG: DUF4476 domain-containing protein [Leptolyngbya sp. SIO1E4]|nr:DUF4476 domain-containing protein [Leptolyngbya sp. SIO1E4]
MSFGRALSPNLPRLATVLMGAGVISWAMPAQAAPQLLYESLQENGNLATCLNRAQMAMTDAGLVQQSPMPNSINGSDSQLTATIYCQAFNNQSFQAMVMVAGEENASLAGMNSVLGALSSAMGTPNADLLPAPTAMDDADFNLLMGALNDSWPNYLEFLAQPISENYFTAAQASQIVETMRFSDEEVQAAVMLYPRVVDLNNWFVVEQAITFDTARQELRNQIATLSTP